MSEKDVNSNFDCLHYLVQKCQNAIFKRKMEEENHYYTIKIGLSESMLRIEERISKINNWDELMNLDEEPDENLLLRSKTIKQEHKENKICFYIFGLFFCLIQLIGVQAGIIILNSLFSEIVEEFQLWLYNTPREYNFYQKLEINTYRELPEIDVGMVTSTIGIIVLKEIGFKKTNSIFQLISSILFALLFTLFHFHTNDKLLQNYNRIEIFVLILSYIILSILVGSSSTIALKELFDITNEIYYKEDKLRKSSEKMIFYLFSGLSMFSIIFLNRLIFTSFKDITSIWLLISIVSICFASFFLSLILHVIYTIPISNKKNKEKCKKIKKIEEEHKDNENKNKNGDIKLIEYKTTNDNELLSMKNNTYPVQNKTKNDINNNEVIEKIQINSTKVCTLCGYIYIKKQNGNQKACIFYRYTNRTTWLKEKIIKFNVIITIVFEFICQLNIVGFNSILYEKLYNEYSFSKNIKFFTALIILSVFWSCPNLAILDDLKSEECKEKEKKEEKENEIDNKSNDSPKNNDIPKLYINKSFCVHILYVMFFLFFFSLFTFISSMCYYFESNKARKRWDNIIMAEFIFFKIIDMNLLSYYDFFDNTDLFNATLFITLEKFIWMLIEAIFEAVGLKEKALIIIQIVTSSLIVIPIIFYPIFKLLFYLFQCSKTKKNK